MKKWVLGMVVGLVVVAAKANVIWQEDFSDVTDWSVIWNPSNDASVVSSSGEAIFGEPSPEAGPAFGPTNRIAFDPLSKVQYDLAFTATAISNSMSYDVALDCFAGDYSYLATVWNVQPNTAFTGSTNINLGGFTFDAGTAYVAPKFTLHTGAGSQALNVDTMSMSQTVPEPAAVVLLGGGLVALLRRRRNRTMTGS